jgi:hypothetical protein
MTAAGHSGLQPARRTRNASSGNGRRRRAGGRTAGTGGTDIAARRCRVGIKPTEEQRRASAERDRRRVEQLIAGLRVTDFGSHGARRIYGPGVDVLVAPGTALGLIDLTPFRD